MQVEFFNTDEAGSIFLDDDEATMMVGFALGGALPSLDGTFDNILPVFLFFAGGLRCSDSLSEEEESPRSEGALQSQLGRNGAPEAPTV